MTDYNYEAVVETGQAKFSFRGDDAARVSAQVSRMPVLMHQKQVQWKIDLTTDIEQYMKQIAEEHRELEKNSKPSGFQRRHSRND